MTVVIVLFGNITAAEDGLHGMDALCRWVHGIPPCSDCREEDAPGALNREVRKVTR